MKDPATADLFSDPGGIAPLGPGAFLLAGFAAAETPALLAALDPILAQAPLRRMVTPGGKSMSVEMSNCGAAGWVTDRRGYRYAARDPLTDRPWPELPSSFAALAGSAAVAAGFAGFKPDVCLINRYRPGARMTPHQDRDERDFTQPIVSVSLGLPAVFLWGGATRKAKAQRILLKSGDVVVWGGPARLFFHGIAPLEAGEDIRTGNCRYNLTFRKAL